MSQVCHRKPNRASHRFTVVTGLLGAVLLKSACSSGATPPPTCSAAPPPAPPVVFVHGSGLSPASWRFMIPAMQAVNYPADYLHAVTLRPSDGDNVRAAEGAITSTVRKALASAATYANSCNFPAPDKVDIVAHSMGAFSSRWYTRFVGPENVRTLVSIAGANRGTNDLCGLPGKGNRQLCPANAGDGIQATLNGTPTAPLDESPYGLGCDSPGRPVIEPDDMREIAYFAIYIDPDEWITPADSAQIDGAGGRRVPDVSTYPVVETSTGNYRWLGNVGHDGLPEDADVIAFVIALLTTD